jgi:hypothetical protein
MEKNKETKKGNLKIAEGSMKWLLILCATLLLLGLADLPIGYYTLLRIVVSIGSVTVIVSEFEKGLSFWVILFGIVLIFFNPIVPVYLKEKSAWVPIDFIGSILFIIKSVAAKEKVK